jgi:branched-chain amino acid transport system permease protein
MKRVKTAALAALIVFLLALPWFIGQYATQIVIMTMTYTMLGLSFAFTMRVGLPRFDIAAWWGVGAYTTAILVTKAGLTFWETIPIACIVAVVLGWLVFRIAVPRGMMVFLMFGMVISLAITQVFGSVRFFGGWGGTTAIAPPAIGGLVLDTKRELYYLGFAFLVFNLICFYALLRSRIGRSWTAIGQSVRLAQSVGIDVVKYRMANVLVGNVFLALTGCFYMAFSLVAVPANFSLANSLNVMMYAVIGGITFTLAGPMVGSLILAFVPQYLRVAKEYEPIITSVVIILIIVFLPVGVLGWLDGHLRLWLSNRLSWGFAGRETQDSAERREGHGIA